MRTLWFRSTEWRSYNAEGQTFRPDAEGYVEIPENVAAQIRDPTLLYVGRERPEKPAEPHAALTSAAAPAHDEPAGLTPGSDSSKKLETPASGNPALRHAISTVIKQCGYPGKSVQWEQFCHLVRTECGKVPDRGKPIERGYGNKTISRAVHAIKPDKKDKIEQHKENKPDISDMSDMSC